MEKCDRHSDLQPNDCSNSSCSKYRKDTEVQSGSVRNFILLIFNMIEINQIWEAMRLVSPLKINHFYPAYIQFTLLKHYLLSLNLSFVLPFILMPSLIMSETSKFCLIL